MFRKSLTCRSSYSYNGKNHKEFFHCVSLFIRFYFYLLTMESETPPAITAATIYERYSRFNVRNSNNSKHTQTFSVKCLSGAHDDVANLTKNKYVYAFFFISRRGEIVSVQSAL